MLSRTFLSAWMCATFNACSCGNSMSGVMPVPSQFVCVTGLMARPVGMKTVKLLPSKPVVLFMFMVFFHHLNHYRQRHDERRIHPLRHINSVTIAEDGELSTNPC